MRKYWIYSFEVDDKQFFDIIPNYFSEIRIIEFKEYFTYVLLPCLSSEECTIWRTSQLMKFKSFKHNALFSLFFSSFILWITTSKNRTVTENRINQLRWKMDIFFHKLAYLLQTQNAFLLIKHTSIWYKSLCFLKVVVQFESIHQFF